MRTLPALLVVLVGAAVAQQPTFDTAAIKVAVLASRPIFGNRGGPGTAHPTRIHLCCVGMFSLLMGAYDVDLDQIIGPSWIMENTGPNLYQIDATMAPGTTKPKYHLMMQHFLEERFHLQVHREKRKFPGYELTIVGGGLKLKESNSALDAGAGNTELPKRNSDGTFVLPPVRKC